MNINKSLNNVVNNNIFTNGILFLIILNALLIGIETSYTNVTIQLIQNVIIYIFVIELLVRWLGRESTQDYLADGWNYFDIIIVGGSLIPTSLVGNNDIIAVFRILRIMRIFRAFRSIKELRMISIVLIKSIKSLSITGIFFLIFMYTYAVIGVSLFKMTNYSGSPNITLNPTNPDPYGNIGEAFFTLFRILTGEDWTDLRYNLLNVTDYSNIVVTTYHVSWMVIAAFLLINLVVGAVLTNYEQVISSLEMKRGISRDQNSGFDKTVIGERKWSFNNCLGYLFSAFAVYTDEDLDPAEKKEIQNCMNEWSQDSSRSDIINALDLTLGWFKKDFGEMNEDDLMTDNDKVLQNLKDICKIIKENIDNKDARQAIVDDLVRIGTADGVFDDTEKELAETVSKFLAVKLIV